MKFRLHHHHHRLNYLLTFSTFANNSLNHVGNSPIDKVAIIENDDCIIAIEYTDGVIEEQLNESTWYANKVINTISQRFSVGSRRKFYVRPIVSETLSNKLRLMLAEDGWELICANPWSYYAGNYTVFYSNRERLREFSRADSKCTFLGRMQNLTYPKVDDSLTKWPVKRSEVKVELDADDGIFHPSRSERIKNFETLYGVSVAKLDTLSEGRESLEVMLRSRVLLQPHGISLRHNIYEGMLLGIPSIIEHTSYNPTLFNLFPQVDFSSQDKNMLVEKVLNDDVFMNEKKAEIIDYFEHNMTPDAIWDTIFRGIQEKW